MNKINPTKFIAVLLVAVAITTLLANLTMEAFPDQPLLSGMFSIFVGFGIGLYVYHGWVQKLKTKLVEQCLQKRMVVCHQKG